MKRGSRCPQKKLVSFKNTAMGSMERRGVLGMLANLEGDRAWRYDKDSYEVNKKKKQNRETER